MDVLTSSAAMIDGARGNGDTLRLALSHARTPSDVTAACDFATRLGAGRGSVLSLDIIRAALRVGDTDAAIAAFRAAELEFNEHDWAVALTAFDRVS